MSPPESPPAPPPTWTLVLAFALVYVCWGTTYIAIQKGVRDEHLPPALFGGSRVFLAGFLLLAYQALRGRSLRLPRADLPGVALASVLLFVCGNGLINLAERTVDSGAAAVLAATTPLWIGLFAVLWPGGERLTGRGWVGLLLGLGGVLLLLAPKLQDPGALLRDVGPLLVLGSAASWALGSLVLRQHRLVGDRLSVAAYQMILGGGGLSVVGLALGEADGLPDRVTAGAVAAFVYLLVVGSLVGFVAFNWLLAHVSAARVGTYAYVNPVIAVFIGWLAGEELTPWIVSGIVVILAGVALVRSGEYHPAAGSLPPEVGETAGDPAAAPEPLVGWDRRPS